MTEAQVKEVQKEQTAPRVAEDDVKNNIKAVEYVKHITEGGQILRWAVITTLSGYGVTGDPSAAVSPENDNQELGEHYAYQNAFRKLWQLMGFALKERLADSFRSDAITQLTLAAEQFEFYEQSHRAKNTEDSLKKAKVNAMFAGAIRATLARA